ncbi:transposase [Enterococcus faecalis]|uniref:transposase n=1 Tax=Enterococcus faecalis TaxID=1351 RepID=UPI004041744E
MIFRITYYLSISILCSARTYTNSNRKFSQERKDMILQLPANGKPVADISREYSIAEQTIYKWEKTTAP